MTRPCSLAEQVSALADGQLDGGDLDLVLPALEHDAALRARWSDYHLIGDVLRGVPAWRVDEAKFLSRLGPALQPLADGDNSTDQQASRTGEAANEAHFRWPWAAAALGSLVLAAGLGWSLLGEDLGDSPELALGEAPLWMAGPQGVVVRDVALEELMAAHRLQGSGSGLATPSGFLRSATFESPPPAGDPSVQAPGR